jgi:hypothetical protein
MYFSNDGENHMGEQEDDVGNGNHNKSQSMQVENSHVKEENNH